MFGVTGAQHVRCLSMALRIVSNLCMQAVSATFLVLPAASKRAYRARKIGLRRLPTSAAMYNAALTVLRPPQTVRLTAQSAAVTIEWRQSDQCADLLAVKDPKLGKIRQQRHGDNRTDARHTAE